MEALYINQEVFIRRSDGRIHEAQVKRLSTIPVNMVTVQFVQDGTTHGKHISLATIMRMNPQIFGPHVEPATGSAQVNRTSPARVAAGANLPYVTFMEPRHLRNHRSNVFLGTERLRVQHDRRRQMTVNRGCSNVEAKSHPHWEIASMMRMFRMRMQLSPYEINAPCQPRKQRQILVCVRKRPLNPKELSEREIDLVTALHPHLLVVSEPRKRVNLTQYLEHHKFRFDHVFDEQATNEEVYGLAARPLVTHVMCGGMATCFAYGQTGSGKTHTMGGEFSGQYQNYGSSIYSYAARDIFNSLQLPHIFELDLKVSCSFFELYGNQVYDLLGESKPKMNVLEDAQHKVQILSLTEKMVLSATDIMSLLEEGDALRTHGVSSANENSSRSHSVFQIILRTAILNQVYGKFSLIDLAGSERGADSLGGNHLSRLEGAEINKSLLALKECIRALGRRSPHLPFRGSKLTHVLRDSFIGGKNVRTCMIATISPGIRSLEQTLNTLRYADRVKELQPHLLNPARGSAPRPPTQIRRQVAVSEVPNTTNAAELNRSSSTISLSENGSRVDTVNGILESYSSNILEDANLEYFNQATDNREQTEIPLDV